VDLDSRVSDPIFSVVIVEEPVLPVGSIGHQGF
jgi:hypothetical protein